MKVAFIDDGINPAIVPCGVVFKDFIADKDGVHTNASPLNEISHGAICYQIFQSCVKHPYQLISIKILDRETGTGTKDALVAALNWCAAQNIDLINMSMGTRQYTDFKYISQVINTLSNTIIVAAYSNQNTLTFPACLKSVVGVRHCSHEELQGNFVYLENPFDQVDILTYANKMPSFLYESPDEAHHDATHAEPFSGSNSFAAPLITARICDYMAQGHRGINTIKQQLYKDSLKNSSFLSYNFYKKMFYDWKETDVPIVAVQGNESLSLLKPLLMKFIDDDYRAVCFTIDEETSVSDFIFKFKQCVTSEQNGHRPFLLPTAEIAGQFPSISKSTELLDLYYNFTLPDIIFLHYNTTGLTALHENLQIDMLLKPQGEDDLNKISLGENYVLNICEDVDALFKQITHLLT